MEDVAEDLMERELGGEERNGMGEAGEGGDGG